MNARGENVDDRAVGGDGPVRRTRITLAVAAGVALVVGLLALAVAPASASGPAGTADADGARGSLRSASAAAQAVPDPSTTPTPTPTPAPQDHLTPAPPTTSPSRPPVRPSIDDPGDITSGTVRFSGTGTPGHDLRVTGPAATGSTGCAATVHDGGTWSCMATVRSGPQQVFTVADQSFPGLGSARTPASDVIVPPVVTTSRPTNGPVSGTGHAGSTITLSVSGSATDRTATVGADGRWTVSLRGGSTGGDGRRSVTATQTASTADGYRSDLRSAASTPVTVTLDRTAPTAPRITAPGSGDRVRVQPVTVSGTGEPGAVLTVSVDRAPVCQAEVPASGRWSCSTTGSSLGAGTRSLTATQHDAAGNFSPTSTAVRVVVSPASAVPGTPG
ncbi:MAG: Ig-like domain-containing protein, partial [Curtobacterium sp.]